MLRTIFIAACLVAASPSIAKQQVRVIAGDIEHIYGPGGELLDDTELYARNERAFARMEIEKQRAIEEQQLEIEVEQFRADQNFSVTRLPSER